MIVVGRCVSQQGSSVPVLITGFCTMKQLQVFLLPLDGIPIHCKLVVNDSCKDIKIIKIIIIII